MQALASYRRIVGLTAFSQAINFLLPLLTLPLLVRALGTETFGKYSVLFGLIAIALVLTEFGYSVHGVRAVASSSNPQNVAREFRVIILAKLLLALAAFPTYLLAVSWSHDLAPPLGSAFTAYAFIVGSCLNPTWYFLASKRLSTYTVLTALCRLCTLAAFYAFVVAPTDLDAAIRINAFGNLLLGVVAYFLAWYPMRRLSTDVRLADIWTSIASTRHLFFANIGVSMYTAANVVIVGSVCGATAAGQFSSAERIVKAVQQLLSSMSTAALAFVTNDGTGGAAGWQFHRRLLSAQAWVLLTTTVVLLAGSREILHVLYKHVDPDSLAVLRILALVVLVGGLSSAINVQVLVSSGRYRIISQVVILGGIINVALAYFLGKAIGVLGAAVAVAVAEAIILALTLLSVRADKSSRQPT